MTSSFFSLPKLYKEWEFYLEFGKSPKRLQQLASYSKSLWQMFANRTPENKQSITQEKTTEQREKHLKIANKYYLDSHQGALGYLACFFWPNVEKVYRLMLEQKHLLQAAWLDACATGELIVVDYGCGPLSGTVGLLKALNELIPNWDQPTTSPKIKIYGIDRTFEMGSLVAKWLEKSFAKGGLSFVWDTSCHRIPKHTAHLALACNVWNELPVKHRLSSAQKLFETVAPCGSVLFLEPGHQHHSKLLGLLRNQLLESQSEAQSQTLWQVVAPCPHNKPCPWAWQPQGLQKTDWCWFAMAWSGRPEFQEQMDKQVGVDHSSLAYSYVWWSCLQMTPAFTGRVVSDVFYPQQNPETPHILICQENGLIEKIAHLSVAQYHRGSIKKKE